MCGACTLHEQRLHALLLQRPSSFQTAGAKRHAPSCKARVLHASTWAGGCLQPEPVKNIFGGNSIASVLKRSSMMCLRWRKSAPLAPCISTRLSSATFKMRHLSCQAMDEHYALLCSLMSGFEHGVSNKDKDFDMQASGLQLMMLQEIGGLCAWNARGLLSSSPQLRRAKLAVAEQIMRKMNVAVIVESHGTHFDCEQVFDDFFKFASLLDSPRGGLLICLRTAWLQDRPLEYQNIIRGRMARVRLSCEHLGTGDLISIYGVHLEAESHQFNDQMKMLDVLHAEVEADDALLKLMVGDWNFESLHADSDEPAAISYAHGRLCHRFQQLFPTWCMCEPDAPTLLGPYRTLDRVCVNIEAEQLEMLNYQVNAIPIASFFQPGRPSDHLPIVFQQAQIEKPAVDSIPRAFAASSEWRRMAQEALEEAQFMLLPLAQGVDLLPILLRQVTKAYRHDLSRIPEHDAELNLYFAMRALRASCRGRLHVAYHIALRAAHWRVHHLEPGRLQDGLVPLVRTYRDKVSAARAQAAEARMREVPGDMRRQQRLQRWTRVLAAWRARVIVSATPVLSLPDRTLSEPAMIAEALREEWAPCFTASTIPLLQASMQEILNHSPTIEWAPQPLVTAEEIKGLLTRTPATAPGPDGVHYAHLAAVPGLNAWIARLANAWLEHGEWPHLFDFSYTIPLPKSNTCWTPDATRPITLAVTLSKVLMRIMSSYLYASVASKIDPNQYGYLHGRQIAEAVIALEHSALTLGPVYPCSAAVFLDLKRAFDSLDREFIFALLQKTSAPAWMVRALRTSYCNQTTAFKVGSHVGASIGVSSGVRQGCPASAILFIFCVHPLLQWIRSRAPPLSRCLAYADDLVVVVTDLAGDGGIFLTRLAIILPQSMRLRLNMSKVKLMPLNVAMRGRATDLLSNISRVWHQTCEVDSQVYLGVLLGPDSCESRFDAIILKMRTRTLGIQELQLGMPAMLGLAKIVVWSIAAHTLSLYSPSKTFMSAFHAMYAFLVKGPPGWLPYHIAVHLPVLQWKHAPPHAFALSMKLQLQLLVRLSGLDVPAMYGEVCDAHLHDDACLLPLTKQWAMNSSLASLTEVERRATLGNLCSRRNGVLLLRSQLRILSSRPQSTQARRILYDWLVKQGPLGGGDQVIRVWLAGRTRWNSDWDSYAGLARLMRLLSAVFKLCPPRHSNAVLRLATRGIVMTTIDDETRCILSGSCGAGHDHQHYFGSSCYVTPRLARQFPGCFPLKMAFRRSIQQNHVRELGKVAYVVVRALNLSRNTAHRPPFVVEHVLLHERWG